MVRSVARVGAIAVLLAGALFFFQGIGLVPGSFMTGRTEWAAIGGAMAFAAVLLFLSRRAG